MRMTLFYRCALVWILAAMSAVDAYGTSETKHRLAKAFIRAALARLVAEPVTIDALDSATLLANEALLLDPENAELWRIALDLAIISENQVLREKAINRLAVLEPMNEPIRLMRLNGYINQHQTVDDRLKAYEQLLWEENISKIGEAVASRLALDMALLYRRMGNLPEFARRLSQASVLDSSNRSAAAIAAGFYRSNVDDPFGEAEMLVNLVLADPTDVLTQVTFARLLLEEGAYKGAERLYSVATRGYEQAGKLPSNELLADRAIAHWAAGNDDDALETIHNRQVEMDNTRRYEARRVDPELSSLELSKLRGVIHPTLATVRAVIHFDNNHPKSEDSFAEVIGSYQELIDVILESSDPVDEQNLVRLYLEMAWVCAWIGNDANQINQFVVQAEQYQSINQVARDRFNGWIAFRNGEYETARELFASIADTDVPARLGLAMTFLDTGDKKGASRELLSVARAQPGSLIGIRASNQLQSLLNRRLSLSDQALRLERLVESIPRSFDRMPDDASIALSLRIRPVALTAKAYEPIRYEIEVINNSFTPLALDREGPIRPQVLIIPQVQSGGVRAQGSLTPIIVNVGHRLRLKPRERLVVTFDLQNYHTAELLQAAAVNGSHIRMTGLINFGATAQGTAVPRLLGSEVDAPIVRIDGVRMTREWLERSIEILTSGSKPDFLETLAFVSHQISRPTGSGVTLEDRDLYDRLSLAFHSAYEKLDGTAQAWLLTVIPQRETYAGTGLEQVISMARKSENRYVQLVYLLYYISSTDDPMIDAARRSEDSVLRRFGELIRGEEMQPDE